MKHSIFWTHYQVIKVFTIWHYYCCVFRNNICLVNMHVKIINHDIISTRNQYYAKSNKTKCSSITWITHHFVVLVSFDIAWVYKWSPFHRDRYKDIINHPINTNLILMTMHIYHISILRMSACSINHIKRICYA